MGRGRKRKRKGHWRSRKKPRRNREVAPLQIPPAAVCPLCKDTVLASASDLPAQRCEGCEVLYHTACLKELGGCSTLGCGLQGKPVAGTLQVRARARPPSVERALTEADRIIAEHQHQEQTRAGQARVLYLLSGVLFMTLSLLSFVGWEARAGIGFGTLGLVALGLALVRHGRGLSRE